MSKVIKECVCTVTEGSSYNTSLLVMFGGAMATSEVVPLERFCEELTSD